MLSFSYVYLMFFRTLVFGAVDHTSIEFPTRDGLCVSDHLIQWQSGKHVQLE